jgi:hypothetical protein
MKPGSIESKGPTGTPLSQDQQWSWHSALERPRSTKSEGIAPVWQVAASLALRRSHIHEGQLPRSDSAKRLSSWSGAGVERSADTALERDSGWRTTPVRQGGGSAARTQGRCRDATLGIWRCSPVLVHNSDFSCPVIPSQWRRQIEIGKLNVKDPAMAATR